MSHAHVPEAYIHFALMYTADNIFTVLTIKDLINKDGERTTSFKLATDNKPSIYHLYVLFCPCIVKKSTAHVGTNALNMCHQVQKGFRGIFVGITKHQKGYLVYVPHKRKIFLHAMLFLMRVFIVRWSTRNIHINRQWLCDL